MENYEQQFIQNTAFDFQLSEEEVLEIYKNNPCLRDDLSDFYDELMHLKS